MPQGKYDNTIKECTEALELNLVCVKALVRRGEAHESLSILKRPLLVSSNFIIGWRVIIPTFSEGCTFTFGTVRPLPYVPTLGFLLYCYL